MVAQIASAPVLRKLLVLVTFSFAFTLTVEASVLVIGGTAPPSLLVPSGSVLATASGTITTPTFTSTYTTSVYADPTNTWCSGCLDFVYQFTNNGPAPNQRYSMSSFAGFNIDAGNNPFGTHDPNTVSRSMSGAGDVISFNFDQFGNDIVPGETTVQLVIETNAKNFVTGFLSAQDGTAGSGVGFAPSGTPFKPVPEPASLMLIGTGILGLGRLLHRRLGKRA